MTEKYLEIASKFDLEGQICEIKPLGEGFINDTLIVKTAGDDPDYILQRKKVSLPQRAWNDGEHLEGDEPHKEKGG